jgi:hypothetical protein
VRHLGCTVKAARSGGRKGGYQVQPNHQKPEQQLKYERSLYPEVPPWSALHCLSMSYEYYTAEGGWIDLVTPPHYTESHRHFTQCNSNTFHPRQGTASADHSWSFACLTPKLLCTGHGVCTIFPYPPLPLSVSSPPPSSLSVSLRLSPSPCLRLSPSVSLSLPPLPLPLPTLLSLPPSLSVYLSIQATSEVPHLWHRNDDYQPSKLHSTALGGAGGAPGALGRYLDIYLTQNFCPQRG